MQLSQKHDDDEEDGEGLSEMQTARQRTKERLAATARKRAEARAAAEREAMSQDDEDEPDDEVTEISPMRLGVGDDADSPAVSARSTGKSPGRRPRTPSKTMFCCHSSELRYCDIVITPIRVHNIYLF